MMVARSANLCLALEDHATSKFRSGQSNITDTDDFLGIEPTNTSNMVNSFGTIDDYQWLAHLMTSKKKILPGALDRKTILKFFDICDWTCWTLQAHSAIEQSPQINAVMKGKDSKFLWNLSAVTQEYALLQLSKLHDPAIQHNRFNLSLDYIIQAGSWTVETRDKLESLSEKLNRILADNIKQARNMTLCHNDLEIVLKNVPLGEWVDSETLRAYVGALQEFVDLVFREGLQDSALCLGDDAKRSAEAFVNTLTLGLR